MSAPPAILCEHARETVSLWTLCGGNHCDTPWWQGNDLQELTEKWPEIFRVHQANLRRCAIIARSTAFLFDLFPHPDVSGSTKRATLAFRLEADLPHSAEELACDFQFDSTANASSKVSAVASLHALWAPLIQQMQRSNCRLELLTPRSLLIAQGLAEQHTEYSKSSLMLLNMDGQFEIIGIERGQVVKWRLPGDLANAARDWRVLRAEFSAAQPVAILASGESRGREAVRAIVGSAEIPVVAIEEPQHSSQLAQGIMAGKSTAWFDLSRDHRLSGNTSHWQHPQNLSPRLLMIVGCLLMVALACYLRAERVRGVITLLKQEQTSLVRRALPEQKISSAVMARLKSEHAKLTGSRFANKSIELPSSIVPAMRQIIVALPTDLPISMHELRLGGGQVYLDVEVGQIQDAALLAQALQASGLSVSPPSIMAAKDGKIRAQLRATPGNQTFGNQTTGDRERKP